MFTAKRLKPYILHILKEKGEVEPYIEAARYGVGLHVAEKACEELCGEGLMKRGRKAGYIQMQPSYKEMAYYIYVAA